MPDVGRYCKAYLVSRFRAYPDWTENLAELRKETKFEDGEEREIPRTELLDDDVLYLQENYVVTDGVFKDQNVIFDEVTEAWKEFCRDSLEFRIPEYVTQASEAAELPESDRPQAGPSDESAAETQDQSEAPD